MGLKSFKYRWWQKFIHKFNYHHMELAHPDGDTLAWCHWCGLRDIVYDPTKAKKTLSQRLSKTDSQTEGSPIVKLKMKEQ
jgi:hypothetical protein